MLPGPPYAKEVSFNCHLLRRLAGKDTCGTGQLMKDYLDQYSRVMDERIESKGMNNFNATVETLLAGKMKSKVRNGYVQPVNIVFSVLYRREELEVGPPVFCG